MKDIIQQTLVVGCITFVVMRIGAPLLAETFHNPSGDIRATGRYVTGLGEAIGDIFFGDDISSSFGNTTSAPDAKIRWDTSGAEQLQVWLNDGDGIGTDSVAMYWLTGDDTTYFGGEIDMDGEAITDSSGPVMIGQSGVSVFGLGSGHVLVPGSQEIQGTAYLGSMNTGGDVYCYGSNKDFGFSSSFTGGIFAFSNTYQPVEAMMMFPPRNSRYVIMTEYPDRYTNFGHAQTTDPTMYWQSSDATDIGQFGSIMWNRVGLGGGGSGYGCINETFAYDDMVDGGGASGTFNMTETIPDGARVLAAILHTLSGFNGDTSATIVIGDGADVDRYNTGTPSVYRSNASGVDLGVPSGTAWHNATTTVIITITSNSDFTSISAGEATVGICYLTP